jgi:hypothetical protein
VTQDRYSGGGWPTATADVLENLLGFERARTTKGFQDLR